MPRRYPFSAAPSSYPVSPASGPSRKEFHICESTFSRYPGHHPVLLPESGHMNRPVGEGVMGGFSAPCSDHPSFPWWPARLPDRGDLSEYRSQVKLFLFDRCPAIAVRFGNRCTCPPDHHPDLRSADRQSRDLLSGRLAKLLHVERPGDLSGLHILTLESSFVVRTFFFVIFGIPHQSGILADIRVVGSAC